MRGDAKDVTLLVPARRAATAAISTLAYAPGNEDGFALITVTPPAAPREDAIPRDITLVLDVSGSMSGRKIEQARAAGGQLLATLRPADRFRLIDFSSDVRTFRDDFVSATCRERSTRPRGISTRSTRRAARTSKARCAKRFGPRSPRDACRSFSS